MYQELNNFQLPPGFRGKSKIIVQLWWLCQWFLFNPSPQVCYGWRRFLLRLFGAKIGKGVLIRPSVKIVYPWKVTIGDYSWIGDEVNLYSLGQIQIGKNTVISQKSYLCGGGHDYTNRNFPIYSKPIIIEDDCWISTDVYIAPGIRVGEGTVVGARSSVFKDLPAGKICYGSPAIVIKERECK
ncbi:putative colanic acid biosynthesis acetyltransferase [Aegicerativicinus sediminis]|uniref:putative colanic acid biosynthesis acetyltransferase n=1 Tax=Aegicerativicinus sediminis TaxID=2893202 RepID=UPI001E405084|nr:putative colanic acid biosynthesis acetyltransferase [Aegicerativicinus sediminis]